MTAKGPDPARRCFRCSLPRLAAIVFQASTGKARAPRTARVTRKDATPADVIDNQPAGGRDRPARRDRCSFAQMPMGGAATLGARRDRSATQIASDTGSSSAAPKTGTSPGRRIRGRNCSGAQKARRRAEPERENRMLPMMKSLRRPRTSPRIPPVSRKLAKREKIVGVDNQTVIG